MDRSRALAAASGRRSRRRADSLADRLARLAERTLRVAADARLAIALLLVGGGWNALAAALPDGEELLATPAYSLLLGGVLLSGLAAFAVRAPAAWREWWTPGPLGPATGREALSAEVAIEEPLGADARERLVERLRADGYRARLEGAGERWAVHATKRGWARFVAIGSHLALVVMLVGAALGTAFSRETVFSLLPGDQALLDTARPGFTDAVRLDAFDAEFGADGRPRRLDTAVTFMRDGQPVESAVLQVNRPGSFGGYLVHGWTYGPAVDLRVTTLGGRPLLDAVLALDAEREAAPAATADLPAAGSVLGVVLIDAAANELAVTVAGPGGVQDAARLRPGEERRIGDVRVRLDGFEAYVTFLSRRDPGMGLLFAGAGLLTASLAIGFWLPRRRLSITPSDAGLRLVLRGERFDQPSAELERVRRVVDS